MSAPELSLLTKRRFAPIFTVQFLGAFNDNLLKFAIFLFANFTLYVDEPAKAQQLATLATGLFILPYLLFSAVAGQMADRLDKAKLVRLVKIAEILFMGVGLAGFWFQSMPLLLTALFLMGLHSTIFGPVKYSILPQHLHQNEVMGGTGIIEAGTFLAILGGQLLAGVIQPWEAGLIATGLVQGRDRLRCQPLSRPYRRRPPARRASKIELNSVQRLDLACDPKIGACQDLAACGWPSLTGISWFFSVGGGDPAVGVRARSCQGDPVLARRSASGAKSPPCYLCWCSP